MKKYILWVTDKKEEGYYSWRYGWSQNLTLTFAEALNEKEKIKERHFDVEIVEL